MGPPRSPQPGPLVEGLSPVLVTGASGFAGRWILRELAARGIPAWAGVRRKSEVPGAPEVVMDLEDPASIFQALDKIRPRGIVHLAAKASPHLSNASPEATYMVNFLGTHRILETCRVLGIAPRVLLVGSATVYGTVGRDEPPIPETHAVRPSDAYSLAKAAAEMLAPVYESHFPVVVARSFNHTGPGQGTDFALPAFASQIARIEAGLQEPVIRVGDLGAQRDFLDVRDVVSAYALLLERGEATTTYNVCSGTCRPVSEWLEQLVGLAAIPVRIERDPSRVFAQSSPRLVGDNSRLKSLGWAPRIAPETMLSSLLEDWRNRIRESP
ncbi:MAG TPA: GDP-mannose 4,6-dehydratase [Fibrobacteria bacterium]|nr:GDP-mannose 4,6-dehydratase [Fibrobacteria bacterium]